MYAVMFGFVSAHRSALPGVAVEKALDIFKKWWGDSPPSATLRNAYFSMQNEFIELQRSAPEDKTFRVQVNTQGRDIVLLIPAPNETEATERAKEMLTYHEVRIDRVEEDRPLIPAA